MRQLRAPIALAAALACAGCATPGSDSPAAGGDGTIVVRTTSGLLRGRLSDDGVIDLFQGVPYATPPLGGLRWKAPRPPASWPGIRDAFAPGSPCPQSGRLAGSNEDCLTLNVWAPKCPADQVPAAGARLPVMVWIHGGGNSIGTTSFYEGGHLAAAGTTFST